ncbi:lipoprotein insertase outer membrane protein LolB [Legionella brunensis]|uniref:Outer-membrane lipoprotein LolB n=1 Tax=Legionella brunensis TaxID=29422 RepID=A0A0W0RZY0_9GAMM|nr:lipoprotein insertase outer membrane protein LolB [Legionella brunensis]KTC76807.1 molecular chaperone LolB [Legionella brunensis]
MTAIKSTLFGSFLLLTACTPRPTMEAPSTYGSSKATTTETAPMAEQTTATNIEKTTDKSLTTKAQANNAAIETIKTTKIAATSSASAVSSWEISGAMAARSKKKGWNVSINWLQRGMGHYQIRLFGPLGSGTVLINKTGGVITFRDGPKTASSSNAEELLKQQTGIRLPVNSLYYWVRGLPAPGHVQGEKRDDAHRLLVLKQSGYIIDYGQYTSVGKTVLPSVIKLQGNGVFIKLVIKRWRI